MSYFAEVDENNIVTRVIAISQENVNTGKWGNPETWVQTSYNTKGGKHYAPNSHEEDSGVALRYNCQWNAPVAHPDDDKMYSWDEDAGNWVEVT